MTSSPAIPVSVLSRRHLLKGMSAMAALAAGAPLLQGCADGTPAGGGGGDLLRVKVTQAVNSLAFAQNYIAQSQGYYSEEGLDVETIVTDGGGPDVQAVLAGSAEFTINDGAQVVTALEGQRQLVAVAATFQRCLVNATMSTKTAQRLGVDQSTDIQARVAALEGLRIGITAPGSLTWQIARFNLIGAGLDPDTDATLVALGGGPSVLAALEQDQVDVIYISVPFGEAAVERGAGVTFIDNSAGEDPSIPSFMMEGLWVTPETLESEGEMVQSMVNALTRASDFLATSEEAAIVEVLAADFPAFDSAVLSTAAGQLKNAVATDGRWDSGAIKVTSDILESNSLLPPGGVSDSIFDDRFLA